LSQDRPGAGHGRWAGGPFEALTRVLEHPGFPRAARALAANMLAVADADPALASVFKDAGRYVAAMWAFYLYAGEGLTLPRLKAVSAQSGLLSPGRARALLQFLEHLGYVTALRRGRGGAAVAYAPTPAFLAAWEAQLRAALEAARCIEPGVSAVLDRLHEPAVLNAFARTHAGGLLGAVSGPQELPSFVRVFSHAHGGSQVVWTLLVSSTDGDFPPHRAGPVSVSAMARRFGVSRIHIMRVFDDARGAGLASLQPDGWVVLEPNAREQIKFLYAVQLAQLLSAAAKTLSAAEAAARAA
jgi:hypothetical protein